MTLALPQNIYAAIFGLALPAELQAGLKVYPSSMISGKILEDEVDAGLMPSFDLLKHHELHISKKIAISFDGLASNAQMHFMPGQNKFENIYLHGDVATNEIILSKILFKEMFGEEIKIHLDTEEITQDEKNYIIVGNDNLDEQFLNKGVSFSDQVAEMIDYPYTNYVVASKKSEVITELNILLKNLDKHVEDNIQKYLAKMDLGEDVNEYIQRNLSSVYYEMTNNEVSGLGELLKLPYLHGMIEEVHELNYVG